VTAPLPGTRQGHLDAVASANPDDLRNGGAAYCESLAGITDDWVRSLFAAAVSDHAPAKDRFALLAVGGFGRGELAPWSDLDLLLVHDLKGKKAASVVEAVASALWYPLWDAGVKLGHAVRTVKEQLVIIGEDLDSATALLTARFLAGDRDLADEVTTKSANAKTMPATWRIGSNPISS
jgi:[protein-PII] uridylyltransferase